MASRDPSKLSSKPLPLRLVIAMLGALLTAAIVHDIAGTISRGYGRVGGASGRKLVDAPLLYLLLAAELCWIALGLLVAVTAVAPRLERSTDKYFARLAFAGLILFGPIVIAGALGKLRPG